MGQTKGGGYTQKETLTPQQQTLLNQVLGIAGGDLSQLGNLSQSPLYQGASEAIKQFLPGGQGFAPIQAEAQRQFQQQTIPSIMNAFGSDAKTSSALNQALAGAGQNLNTALASQLSQMQLGAAGQAAGLSQLPYNQAFQGAQLGLGTQPFAYLQRQNPLWQDLLLAGTQAAGKSLGASGGAALFGGS